MDSLHVAVPVVASGAIGISSETKERDEDYWRRLKQFKGLWATVESIADRGKVGWHRFTLIKREINTLKQNSWQITSIGLCDVEAETLKQIHDGADKVKPSSITVRYASSYSFSPHGS